MVSEKTQAQSNDNTDVMSSFKEIISSGLGIDSYNFAMEIIKYCPFLPTQVQLNILKHEIDNITSRDIKLEDHPADHVRRSGRTMILTLLTIILVAFKKNVTIRTHVLSIGILHAELGKWLVNNPDMIFHFNNDYQYEIRLINSITTADMSGRITISTNETIDDFQSD
jgi:hypothetical protein